MYNWQSYISRGPSHKDIKKKYKNVWTKTDLKIISEDED